MIVLGQEISFTKSDIAKQKNKKMGFIKYGALVSSVAAIFVVLLLTFFPLNTDKNGNVYAYIDVDTNLSLRLSIDDKNKVLGVNPINDTTRVIIDDLNLESKQIDDALSDIINKSKEVGFKVSNANEYVMISASLNAENSEYKRSKKTEEQKLDKLLDEVNENINNIKDMRISTKFIQVDPEIRKLASEKNVSMGRYVQYIKTKEKGIDITIDEARKSPLKEIINKAGVDSSNGKVAISEHDSSVNSKPHEYTSDNGYKNNSDSAKPSAIASDSRMKPSIRPIPSPYKPYILPPKTHYTRPPENGHHVQVSPSPLPSFNNSTIPPFDVSPNSTFIRPRTIIPYKSPTPHVHSSPGEHATPRKDDNTTPTSKVHTTVPTPIVTPIVTPAATSEHAKAVSSKNNFFVNPASDITSYSASISGEVTSLEHASFNPYINYFVSLIYWESSSAKTKRLATSVVSRNFPIKLSTIVGGLKSNSEYKFQLVVNNILFSNVESFRTLSTSEKPKPTSKPHHDTYPNQYPFPYLF